MAKTKPSLKYRFLIIMAAFGMQIFLSIAMLSALKITEIELNPSGTDSGNEWIELYSDSEIDLSGYKLVNNDGDEINLNGVVKGYYVYTFKRQWLDNTDEKVFLYKDNTLIDESPLMKDSKNDGFTWSYCNSEWKFAESTKGFQNCDLQEEQKESEKTNELNISYDSDNSQNESIDTKEGKTLNLVYNETKDNKTAKKDIITLHPKDIKTKNNKDILGRYAIYSFVGFCILLAVLITIEKLRKRKNEFG